MPIPFSCPHCGAFTEVQDEYAGATGPCKKCGQMVTVPGHAVAPRPTKSSSSWIVILAVVAVGFMMCSGLLLALLLPAVQAAREAARRVSSQNNLRQIGLALHNYHDVYGAFPPAFTVDANGKPLHSWRTLLLPFLEQQALYQQIDLSQPWDSPRNQAFAATDLAVFRHPQERPGSCSYVAILGPEGIFQGAKSRRIPDIVDGTSNTLFAVECGGRSQSWMAPVDLDASKMKFTVNGTPADPRTISPRGINILMVDGSTRFLEQSVDPAIFRAMYTAQGGENAIVPSF